MAYIGLTKRAVHDIQDIELYSIEKWGKDTAVEYLQSIENALNLLRENPTLLRLNPETSESLPFYRVREHFLVCASFESSIFVLTIKHGAMDLPNRLAELEPQLVQEAEMLYQTYLKTLGAD
jgi:plasmid stabilization system protein ParE